MFVALIYSDCGASSNVPHHISIFQMAILGKDKVTGPLIQHMWDQVMSADTWMSKCGVIKNLHNWKIQPPYY